MKNLSSSSPSIQQSKPCNLSLLLAFIVLAISSLGCSNQMFPDTFIALNPEKNYKPTSADSVQLYVTQLPSKPYHEIGILYISTRTNRYDASAVNQNLAILKKIAANHGADAVIRLDVTDFNIKGVAVSWK